MYYCYKLARERLSDYYSVVNVANIKEFLFSIGFNSEIVFSGCQHTDDEYVKKYCDSFPTKVRKSLSDGIHDYFSAFGDIGDEEYNLFCRLNNFNYHKYADALFPIYALNDGFLCWYIRRPFEDNVKFFNSNLEKVFELGLAFMKRAKDKFVDIYNILSDLYDKSLKGVFGRQWLYQAIYWEMLLKAGQTVFAAVKNVAEGMVTDLGNYYKKHLNMLG